jgi:thiamine-monophosphate kinase
MAPDRPPKNIAEELSEFGLIDRIRTWLSPGDDARIIAGIGDDAAVVALDEQHALLFTCDMLVENTHFRRDWIDWTTLGRRAAAVNLSDIAAMGGKPTWALVSLACPPDMQTDDFSALFAGLRDELAEYGAHCVGGNLSRTAAELVIDVTLLGEQLRECILLRQGAKPGDGVFISGFLRRCCRWIGASATGRFSSAGTLSIFGKCPAQTNAANRPRSGFGCQRPGERHDRHQRRTGRRCRPPCDASKVGVLLEENRLPGATGIEEVARRLGIPLRELLFGGECYELLFTVSGPQEDDFVKMCSAELEIPLHRIGTIVPAAAGRQLVDLNGQIIPLPGAGFDHFGRR